MRASAAKIEQLDLKGRHRGFREALAALCVLAAAACLFALLFNRETALSYSIGYNLYGAERILRGEVPYRDFHTLYPPAIVYLNAAVFSVWGAGLYAALLCVLVFKALTTTAIYLAGRQIMPRAWAAVAALYSVVWLRPNGPFKAVPMHYGALLLAVGLFWMLRCERDRRAYRLAAAGLSVGLLALFKHNIGAYALVGFLGCLLLQRASGPNGEDRAGSGSRVATLTLSGAGWLLLGFCVPVVPVLVYLKTKEALGAMVRTLLFGPGEFLASRFAGVPSPVVALLSLAVLAGFGWFAYTFRFKPAASMSISFVAGIAAAIFCIAGSEAQVSSALFYAPVAILSGGVAGLVYRKRAPGLGKGLAPLVIAAGAAFMETFPRFAREQVIASMPFVGLLLIYLAYEVWRAIVVRAGSRRWYALAALAVVPGAFLLLGLRFFHQTFFVGALRIRSDTELGIQRGWGVYFPAETAREIDRVTAYIQERVPAEGFVFPQSYAGSSFLFLADRRNPSSAQFWGGVGVNAGERASTLASLEQKRVGMIITSARDLEAEKYEPMREYIARNFRETAQFGEVMIMERDVK